MVPQKDNTTLLVSVNSHVAGEQILTVNSSWISGSKWEQSMEARSEVCPRVCQWRPWLQSVANAVSVLQQDLAQLFAEESSPLGTSMQTKGPGSLMKP